MWLLLDTDGQQGESAKQQATAQGIALQVVGREEQLTAIDPSTVALALVGEGWREETVTKWRGEDACPVVAVCGESEQNARERARRLKAVDVVTYPLPVQYLRHWARAVSDGPDGPESGAPQVESRLHAMLREKGLTARAQERSDEVENGTTAQRGKIVALIGAKGGAGRTTLALLLGRHLAGRGYDVAVVDLAPRGELRTLCRTTAAVTLDEWSRLPAQMDERSVRQALVQTSYGFWLLPSGESAVLDGGTVRRILYTLAAHFDAVIVDTAGDEATATVAAALASAQRVIGVVTPEWPTFLRQTKGIKQLQAQKGASAVSVIANLATSASSHARTLRLFEEALPELPLYRVAYDATLARELRYGKPPTGGAGLQKELRKAAAACGFDPVVAAAREGKRRWFR